MKQAYVVIASLFFAFAAGAAALAAPGEARAATGENLARQCGGGEIRLDDREYETFQRHNKIRRDRGLPAFCVDPKLTEAAEAHSQEMIDNDYFSHDSYDGRRYYEDFGRRIERFGYSYRTAGENIAWGTGSLGAPQKIMRGWMKSPGHKKNILDRRFREIGVGVVEGQYRSYGNAAMYTVDFGTKL